MNEYDCGTTSVPINRNTYHDGVVLLIVWGTARDGDSPTFLVLAGIPPLSRLMPVCCNV